MENKKYSNSKVLGTMILLLFKTSSKGVLIILLFNVVAGIIPAITTLLWKVLFDNAYYISLGQVTRKYVFILIALYIGIQVISKVINYFNNITVIKIKEIIKFNLLSYTHEKISEIPLENYENSNFYDSAARANEILNSNQFVLLINRIILIFQSIITCITVTTILASFNYWLIALCIISIMPSSIARIVRGKSYYYMTRHQTPKKRILSYYIGLLTSRDSIKELRIFDSSNYIEGLWMELKKELQDEEDKFNRKHGFIQFIFDLSRILGLGVGIIFCALLTIVGKLSIGSLGAAITAIQSVQNSYSTIIINAGTLSNSLIQIRDLFEFLDIKPVKSKCLKYEGSVNKIELQNVNFAYPGSERLVLKNINLSIKKGEHISIVGLNGSGKSTLIKVITGIFAPKTGQVKYDEVDFREYESNSVYENISCVFQDYVKYLLTVRENIAFGDIKEINNDLLIKDALLNVDLEKLICSTPKGIDTMVGKEFDGIEFSTGQWQKIAIARGKIKASNLIILDEPTAALDPVLEAKIYEQFLQLTKEKTSIVITHRIGSARLADRIIVMKDGEVIEEGNHEFLLNKNGEYSRLYNIQAKWYL